MISAVSRHDCVVEYHTDGVVKPAATHTAAASAASARPRSDSDRSVEVLKAGLVRTIPASSVSLVPACTNR